jgi:hypothetical protein
MHIAGKDSEAVYACPRRTIEFEDSASWTINCAVADADRRFGKMGNHETSRFLRKSTGSSDKSLSFHAPFAAKSSIRHLYSGLPTGCSSILHSRHEES